MSLSIELKWRDVSVDGLPNKAQEVLFVRNNKTVHGAFIGGSFWYNNQKCCALYWMPLPNLPKEKRSMKIEEMRDLVRECGLDWQKGYTLSDEEENRYVILIEAATEKQEKLISFIMKEWVPDSITREDIEELMK